MAKSFKALFTYGKRSGPGSSDTPVVSDRWFLGTFNIQNFAGWSSLKGLSFRLRISLLSRVRVGLFSGKGRRHEFTIITKSMVYVVL